MLAFPVSGLIFSLTALAPGVGINPASDAEGFAKVAGTVAAANLAGIVGIVILLFGFQALYSYMLDTSVGRWAFAGMVSSTAGMGFFLPFIGIFAFAAPVGGRLYLSGQTEALRVVIDSTSPSNFFAFLFGGLSILMSTAGSIIFADCIWQCGKLPKWSGIPYAIASPLSTYPSYSVALWFLGGLLLLASGLWITRSVWRKQ